MIIQCEKCATRFKVADDKVSGQGIKVRCSKCQHVFSARADGAAPTGPKANPSRPTGIFAPPSLPAAASLAAGSTSDGSSSSMSVPQASLTGDGPAFNPFAAPGSAAAMAGTSSSSSQASAGGFSFELDDGPPPSEDRSLFGPANHTIGGDDDDDVPAPPPASDLLDQPPAPPPQPAPSQPPQLTAPPRREVAPLPPSDPFANPLNAGQSADPFGTQPPAEAAGFSDPFGGTAASSTPSAVPAGGNPFGQATAGDPFGRNDPFMPGGDPFASAPHVPALSTPPGADPFGGGAAAPFPPAPVNGSTASGTDPFSGLGVDVEDSYSLGDDEPKATAPPPVPTPAPAPAAAPPPVPAKPVVSAPKTPRRKLSLRIPPSVPRAAWAVMQAGILVVFLTASIVFVRGGSFDDVVEGRGLDVVLGSVAPNVDGGEPVRVEEVVVARRPVAAADDLVVVSGYVNNAGVVDAPAARVTVSFGSGPAVTAWANTGIDGVDLVAAADAQALLSLNDMVPGVARVTAGERVPFVVLARGVQDGATATVTVEVGEPPSATAPADTAPVDDAPATRKGRRGRRAASQGERQEAAAPSNGPGADG